MRLDKFLANNIGTRSQAKKDIKSGKVTVNDEIIKKNEYKVLESDIVKYEGKIINNEEFVYYLLNKPKNVVSATSDNLHQTVLSLLSDDDYRKDIFPVGRLDIDTTGLLILTNDGKFAHEKLSPKKHVSKKYYVIASGIVDNKAIKLFEDGIVFKDGTICKSSMLKILTTNEKENYTECIVEIFEGKFHQVKKMFFAIDSEVIELKRISFGNLELDKDLAEGDYRKLSVDEVKEI